MRALVPALRIAVSFWHCALTALILALWLPKWFYVCLPRHASCLMLSRNLRLVVQLHWVLNQAPGWGRRTCSYPMSFCPAGGSGGMGELCMYQTGRRPPFKKEKTEVFCQRNELRSLILRSTINVCAPKKGTNVFIDGFSVFTQLY